MKSVYAFVVKLSLIVLVCLCSFSVVWAQNIRFYAQSAEKVGLDDQFQVDYTIENAGNLAKLTHPDFKNVRVLSGPNRSQSTRMVQTNSGVDRTESVTFSYILQATKEGTLHIPALTLETDNGQVYRSNDVTVQVVKGSVRPARQQRQSAFSDPMWQDPFEELFGARRRQQQQQLQQRQQQQQAELADLNNLDKSLFIKVHVDKTNVVVGEQITAYYKLYARLPMNMSISKLPSLNGFWTQDFILPQKMKPSTEVIDGKEYQVFTLKKSALFPQQVGELILDPAEAKGQVYLIRKQNQRHPFADMFENDPFFQFFGGSLFIDDPFSAFGQYQYEPKEVEIKSKPVKIQVRELPIANKPANYTGAVGKFSVEVSVDKQSINTNDAITLTLKVKGAGNLKLFEAPELPLPNGLTAYEPTSIDSVTSRTTEIAGYKQFTWTLNANEAGSYTIPAIPFSYYDPQSKSYVTVETKPISIEVAQGKVSKQSTIEQVEGATILMDSQAYNKVSLWSKSAWFWLWVILLPIITLAYRWYKNRQIKLAEGSLAVKKSAANKVAFKRLKKAEQFLKENNKNSFYEEMSKALWLYLSDQLQIPLAQLSKQTVHEAFAKRQIPEDLEQQFTQLVDNCAAALYAPQDAAVMQNDYNSGVALITRFESQIFKKGKKGFLSFSLMLALLLLLPFMANAQWEKGIQHFNKQQYHQAIVAWEPLTTKEPTYALHYNLGMAHLKAGQLGKATYYFGKAIQINPSADMAYKGLKETQYEAELDSETTYQQLNSFQTWVLPYQSNRWATLAIVLVALFGIIGIVMAFKQWRPWYRNQLLVGLGLLAILSILLTVVSANNSIDFQGKGVVVPANVVMFVDKDLSVKGKTLSQGQIVDVTSEAGSTIVKVRSDNGLTGYVQATDVLIWP